MPTLRVKNITGGTLALPASGSHYAGLAVAGSYTAGQVKTGEVGAELIEEFMAAMAAGITGGSWTVVQTDAVWPLLERTEDIVAGPVADNGAMDITAPVRLRTLGYTPVAVRVYTVGAGAVGARTQTHLPIVDAAGTGVELGTYNESTGVLGITNRNGAPVSDAHVQVAWARVTV